jgi:hypothetical protein
MASALHIKLVDADAAVSAVDQVLAFFADPGLVEVIVACESKLGLLYSHASIDWRRFEALVQRKEPFFSACAV